MRLLSINVGMSREVEWQGATVSTGIFKNPVAGKVLLRRFNLDGDGQADLSVHGGRDKAVYAYPSEHYQDWQARLARSLPPGAFGENFTTEGLLEDRVHIGDEFRIGTARLVVTQPRMPCFKLGIRFGDPLLVKTFLKVGLPGIYFAVTEEGEVAAGGTIELVRTNEHLVTVTDMLKLILTKNPAASDLERILQIPELAMVWREEFQARLRH